MIASGSEIRPEAQPSQEPDKRPLQVVVDQSPMTGCKLPLLIQRKWIQKQPRGSGKYLIFVEHQTPKSM